MRHDYLGGLTREECAERNPGLLARQEARIAANEPVGAYGPGFFLYDFPHAELVRRTRQLCDSLSNSTKPISSN